ncbi:Stk1 family PASTA domain-containing Ser/Thr kinase [Herbiconiux sp. KACC 21604]|uniref:Stk1 family PASTA domain-containing Ser/Thr kinase n=1 Tax=unclassified Herbiconiux TaxID=2618217 RepID=UPI0014930878|nr:Stk1 family PASTA domain-containing Ser/Thr kinase [Herbiconiux sp. SALV-R1]QJU55489.1 Stk1 family PASTA domain-containing Ser/Thr kinase [Herbiconiux sp. SALV-R1]WPO86673.1 Stk1 family PASTA domain-containing Ser/Thr kinase [Herbiconiux sp. KACC 21604]
MTDDTRLLAGRYRLGELIGRGGMSNVYSGRDERLGRQVAIKLLKSSLAGDPVFRTRFRQEAQAASRMAHPTIVRVFDAGEERVAEAGGFEGIVPFIVMEFVEGKLLKDIIKEGPVDSAEAIRITEGILTALEYSHRAGVVHRDIKPGNVMVTHGGQVKVMDFGIARAISDSSATVAQTTAILGTAQYFSPEQARGESVDARTDLYSTGVVLFEMLTGEPPFKGETPVAVAYQHVSEMPVAPSSINPFVSPAIDQVVLHALAKDRFARFQSAVEFKADLEVAGAGKIPSKRLPAEDFQSSLFGAPPSLTQGNESALTQLAGDDEYSVRTQSRPPVVWIWAGIASVAVILVAIVFWVLTLQPTDAMPSTSREVPNVSGQSFEAADATLQQLDLVTQRFDVNSDTVPAGQVVETDPASGTIVSPGTVIEVRVSLGKQAVAVPDVRGTAATDAASTLSGAGFVVGQTIKENSPDVPADVVIRTDPEAGSDSFSGDTIDLVVSTGLVTVPDLTGLGINDADARLTADGIPVTRQPVTGCQPNELNTVRSQSAMGDLAQKSPVTITFCAS